MNIKLFLQDKLLFQLLQWHQSIIMYGSYMHIPPSQIFLVTLQSVKTHILPVAQKLNEQCVSSAFLMIKLHKGSRYRFCLITPEPTKYIYRLLNLHRVQIELVLMLFFTYLTIDFHVARAKTKTKKVVSEVRVLHCS